MRIIRNGRKPEDREHRATCTNCDTRFEFAQKEAKYITDQRDGDYLHICCPVCGHSVAVSP